MKSNSDEATQTKEAVLRAETELKHWPAQAAAQLNALIEAHAHQGAYAVFDMDNTSYRYDIAGSLLPYLEMKGVLTRETMDPSLKLLPFKDRPGYRESLNSYYFRLCEFEDLVSYPWVSQIFAGFTLKELKGYVDQVMSYGKPIPITYYDADEVVQGAIHPPQVFTGMTELFNRLRENGIEVWIISAVCEEVVRMIASDPRYGYNVKPQNVIGINTLLKDRATGTLTTSRLQIRAGNYDHARNLDLELTPYLVNPMTWMEGKLGTIHGWIDQWKKPILVAGDTPVSDSFMLQNGVDIDKGGARIWVNRKPKHMSRMKSLWEASARRQQELGLAATADKNWIVVAPEDIL
jgi:phosphoserine phosphatase